MAREGFDLVAMRVDGGSATPDDRTGQTTFTTMTAEQTVICMCCCPAEGHSRICQVQVPAGQPYIVCEKPDGLTTRMCPTCAVAVQRGALVERWQ